MHKPTNYMTKIVFIGDSGVGKTNVLNQYIHGRPAKFDRTTIGADFFDKMIDTVDGKTINVQFWDTAGQEQFRSMNKMYYRDANAVVIMYDITRPSTFDHIKMWLEEIEQNINENIHDLDITIIGNKTDLDSKRMVPRNSINNLKESYNFTYEETSIKNEEGINIIFDNLVQRIINNGRTIRPMQIFSIADANKDENSGIYSYCCYVS